MLKDSSHLFGANVAFIEEVYERYLRDPDSVDASWKEIFNGMGDDIDSVLKNLSGAPWAPRNTKIVGVKDEQEAKSKDAKASGEFSEEAARDSINALMLVRAFKVRGNLLADLDPLGIEGHKPHPDLDPATYGFSEEDYDREIFVGGVLGFERTTLRELLAELKKTYASKMGVEFMHIPDLERREWISERLEATRGRPILNNDDKKTILEDIIKVQEFEQFLHTKFPGAKRFSAEGGEAVIAAMEKVIETAANLGVKEIVLGMPHRGRLNVLTKVMGRRYAGILSEFQGNQAAFSEEMENSGDVKYHQGASSDREFGGKNIHLSLAANPSHLEAVNPVVVGRVRAKQDQFEDKERKQVMGLLLHGDAAFAGQGIVPETMGLSDLQGYTTGGTIHVIVNNQIGFTTAPKYSRSSPYPTDIAKGAHAPIFHINGDDPEAVVFASRLAVEFRQRFGADVVVDVFCYRKFGHNEGDEPMFTQPIMYDKISAHPTPMEVYAKKLIGEGVITEAEYEEMRKKFKSFLEDEFQASKNYKADEADWLKGSWTGLKHHSENRNPETGVSKDLLKKLGKSIASYPDEVQINSKVKRLFKNRMEMIESGKNIDWGMGEALAFASLLHEKHDVRLSGQDSIRGTFSHRHSAIVDQKTEKRYFPLNNLDGVKARFEGIDSNLSEFAVLGFEYGYTLAEPNSLVIWEAQFGDFSNGAQIIIDQFISSGEAKWLRLSGLIMLLPHGYEGQGPEHSSARPERYLQMCAEDNMQVVNCTTPANFFHVLRRQLHRDFRKPLVVLTPKSLLRHKLAVSKLEDFTGKTSFKPVIEETEKLNPAAKIKRVVLCSGKVYYELLEERQKQKNKDVALIRVEQYYPFPDKELAAELKKYKNAEVIWCQEEPENMGAWLFIDRRIEAVLKSIKAKHSRPRYVGRPEAAAPAAGYSKIHNRRQEAIITEALAL